ncbi:MAG: SpoIIE family protein phosphatase [Treponema sp.]|nr:SpoIIE family protein phosphatase [Treponema sp.]
MKHKPGKLPIITKRIILNVFIAGTLLCGTLFAVGVWSFSKEFTTQYDASIRAISAAACECLPTEKLSYYAESKQKDAEYIACQKILQDFVDKFELNLLYVSIVEPPDYIHITYVFNQVNKDGRLNEYPLGYEEDYINEHYNSSVKRVYENAETIVRHTVNVRSGSHITANVPVYDSTGKVIAVVGAQKSIQEYVNARRSYIRFVLIISIFFALLFAIFFGSYFNNTIISPIIKITKETDHFASWGGKPSDTLLEITNKDEIGILAHSVRQMEYDIYQGIEQLTKVTAEKERINTELDLASKIQTAVLRKGYPAFPERKDFDLFATMNPAKEVGGDLYDYQLLEGDKLLLVVGDVSGKGIPAALYMMIALTLISSYAQQGHSPKDILEYVNNHLCYGNTTGTFVTCWLGIIDLKTRKLSFVNAGHPAPVIFKDGKYSYLEEKPDLFLGAMEDVPYTEHSVKLKKGDSIFIFTDGVTEATNKEEELFGEERLLEKMGNTTDKTAPQTLEYIKAQIDSFVGDAPQFDDTTMLQLQLL